MPFYSHVLSILPWIGVGFSQALVFCVCWSHHIFFFSPLIPLNYTDWSFSVESTCVSGINLLVVVYYHFYKLVRLICQYFVEDFSFVRNNYLWFSCDFFVWFWYQGIAGLIKWVRNSSFLFCLCRFLLFFSCLVLALVITVVLLSRLLFLSSAMSFKAFKKKFHSCISHF